MQLPERHRRVDLERAARLLLQECQLPGGLAELGEDPTTALVEILARAGHRQLAGGSAQELNAHRLLEAGDALADQSA